VAGLLGNREAVAHGLSVMASRMLFEQLPGYLARVVGEKQAAVLLGRFVAEAAREGFRDLARRLGVRDLPPPIRLLAIFFSPPRPEQRVHPFQVAEHLETGGGRIVLVLEPREWSLPILGLLAGVVAGVLDAAGERAVPLTEPSAARHLCGEEPRPGLVVYPERRGGRWALVVGEPSC
jgi:hypothetical protein